MQDGWACCRAQQSEGESGQRRLWVEGKAREDAGKEEKLERGLEHGWWPGRAWMYLRKDEVFLFVSAFAAVKYFQMYV